jgi:hypothetical protein
MSIVRHDATNDGRETDKERHSVGVHISAKTVQHSCPIHSLVKWTLRLRIRNDAGGGISVE